MNAQLDRMDKEDAAAKLAAWRKRAVDATNLSHALGSRCCALEDKLSKLLDLIESEQIVTDLFIKEARFLVEVGKK